MPRITKFGRKKRQTFEWKEESNLNGSYFLVDEHFNKIWRELILADPKKTIFLQEEILVDFGGVLANSPNPPKFLPLR